MGAGCSGRPSAGLCPATPDLMPGARGLLAPAVKETARQVCNITYQVPPPSPPPLLICVIGNGEK